jgi:hypothetical protein
MRRPNFFIAGAPRCGTTALYTYLSEHPNIFLPEIKELHYFAPDFPGLHKIAFKSLDDYLQLFENATDQHLAIGEVSPLYLYSDVALEKIKEFNPLAKMILILRNPVDFVQSLHQVNVSLLREDEPDLAKAWELQDVRREGKMIPKGCRDAKLILYGELGLFGKYARKALDVFAREQVLFILFDDFVANPKAVYESILSFLEVPSDSRTSFPPVNANYRPRSKLVARIIHPPQPVYRSLMKILSLFGVGFMNKINVLYSKVETLNADRVPRAAIHPALRASLQRYFSQDIERLSGLIQRDLSAWLVSSE